MKRSECKAGVRVYWPGDGIAPADTGTIIECNVGNPEDVYSIWSVYDGDNVWVEWSDGDVLHIGFDELMLETDRPSNNVEQAVMLLLSLGYTITGPQK